MFINIYNLIKGKMKGFIIMAEDKISELNRKVHSLKHFHKEEIASTYLIRFSKRNIQEANTYADKQIKPTIDLLEIEINNWGSFIRKYNHLIEINREEGISLNNTEVSNV